MGREARGQAMADVPGPGLVCVPWRRVIHSGGGKPCIRVLQEIRRGIGFSQKAKCRIPDDPPFHN